MFQTRRQEAQDMALRLKADGRESLPADKRLRLATLGYRETDTITLFCSDLRVALKAARDREVKLTKQLLELRDSRAAAMLVKAAEPKQDVPPSLHSALRTLMLATAFRIRFGRAD